MIEAHQWFDVQSANNTMTTADCLAFCAEGFNGTTMQYAGIEYGAYLLPPLPL